MCLLLLNLPFVHAVRRNCLSLHRWRRLPSATRCKSSKRFLHWSRYDSYKSCWVHDNNFEPVVAIRLYDIAYVFIRCVRKPDIQPSILKSDLRAAGPCRTTDPKGHRDYPRMGRSSTKYLFYQYDCYYDSIWISTPIQSHSKFRILHIYLRPPAI